MGAHRRDWAGKFAFGKQLLTFRTRASLTQSALAEKIGVHVRSVQNWEAGVSYPKAETLQQLIAVFLSHRVFPPGDERAEALALWSLAAEDGPHALAAFDDAWFTRTLALQGSGAGGQGSKIADRGARMEEGDHPFTRSPVHPFIDWGEAIAVPKREVLAALESLRRRVQIEAGPDRSTFTLQPVILEFVTDQLVQGICQELVDGSPGLLHRHALVQATAKEYVRRSQERRIATPLLERLAVAAGGADAVERQLLTVLDSWRDQPLIEIGYGPGNVINLLRLLRGHLRGLDLARLAIRQVYLQGVEAQDTSLGGAVIHDSLFTEAFDDILAVAISSSGAYWAASSRRGEIRVWEGRGLILRHAWRAHTDMV